MKKITFNYRVCLVAERNEDWGKLDYYILLPDGQRLYAFTRKFFASCYRACRSGIPINTLLTRRQDNEALMNLVKYLRRMVAYLLDYYEELRPWSVTASAR